MIGGTNFAFLCSSTSPVPTCLKSKQVTDFKTKLNFPDSQVFPSDGTVERYPKFCSWSWNRNKSKYNQIETGQPQLLAMPSPTITMRRCPSMGSNAMQGFKIINTRPVRCGRLGLALKARLNLAACAHGGCWLG